MTEQNESAFAETKNVCPPHLARKARLTPPDAAEYLEAVHGLVVAVATLAKLRSVGGGPQFYKFNRAILYSFPALDRWAAEKLGAPVSNTSARGF